MDDVVEGDAVLEIWIAADGRYLGASSIALEVLGFTADELRALPLGALSGNDPELALDAWTRIRRGEFELAAPRAGELVTKAGALVAVVHLGTEWDDGESAYVSRSHLRAAGDPELRPSLVSVLRDWRDAERELAGLAAEDPQRIVLELEVERFRHLYQSESRRLTRELTPA